MCKIKYLFSLIIFLFSLALAVELENFFTGITIDKPEKLNIIHEQILINSSGASENQEISSSQNTVEISDIDLDIPTKVLFSEANKPSLYDRPDSAAVVIGSVEPGIELTLVKEVGAFAKIKVSSEHAAWLPSRYLEQIQKGTEK